MKFNYLNIDLTWDKVKLPIIKKCPKEKFRYIKMP